MNYTEPHFNGEDWQLAGIGLALGFAVFVGCVFFSIAYCCELRKRCLGAVEVGVDEAGAGGSV
jgi:hypothetical protein